MKEDDIQELVIGKRNKKDIIKKIKWFPGMNLISKESYDKYLEFKERYKGNRCLNCNVNYCEECNKKYNELEKIKT